MPYGLTDEEREREAEIAGLTQQRQAIEAEIEVLKDKRRLLALRIDDALVRREAARQRAGRPTTALGG